MPGRTRTPSRIRNCPAASLKGRLAPRRTPLATALASLALVGAGAPHAQPAAFSSGWFAAKGAAQANTAVTGRLPNGQPALGLPDGARASRRPRASSCNARVGNLGRTAASIAAQQAGAARGPRCRAGHGRRRGAERPAEEVSRWTPIP